MILCKMQGFGTAQDQDRALAEMEMQADIYQDANAALYVAEFYEQEGEATAALQFYLDAVHGGCPEALEALRRFRLRLWCNPFLWGAFLRAKKAYQENCGSYQPIEIPWKV